jgi:uncharacterized protein with GYD domain
MPTYVILMNWTDQGARHSRDTLERAQAFGATIQNRRGKIREHLYTFGEYDIVMVAEFPDDEAAVAAVLHLGELGNVRTKTMRAFTNQEAGAIISLLG